MDVFFRPAAASDLETLLPLLRDFYAYDNHPYEENKSRRALLNLLQNPALGLAWLIEVGGSVAGYMVICFGYSLEFGGRDAFLDELYLKEVYRGQGIGRQAIEYLAVICHEQGLAALHLEVERSNTGARDFYRRLGFEDRGSTLLSRYVRSE